MDKQLAEVRVILHILLRVLAYQHLQALSDDNELSGYVFSLLNAGATAWLRSVGSLALAYYQTTTAYTKLASHFFLFSGAQRSPVCVGWV